MQHATFSLSMCSAGIFRHRRSNPFSPTDVMLRRRKHTHANIHHIIENLFRLFANTSHTVHHALIDLSVCGLQTPPHGHTYTCACVCLCARVLRIGYVRGLCGPSAEIRCHVKLVHSYSVAAPESICHACVRTICSTFGFLGCDVLLLNRGCNIVVYLYTGPDWVVVVVAVVVAQDACDAAASVEMPEMFALTQRWRVPVWPALI